MRLLTQAQKNALLPFCLKGPAGAAFTSAAITTGDVNSPERYNTYTVWLTTTYHTEELKQAIKDQLNTMVQKIEESPEEFYTKICYLINIAEYANTIKDQIAEQTFVRGVHREISEAIRTTPMALDLTQKVAYAKRIWTAKYYGNPEALISHSILPTPTNIVPTAVLLLPRPQTLRATPTLAAISKKKDDMDDFIKKFSELTVNLNDIAIKLGQQQKQ